MDYEINSFITSCYEYRNHVTIIVCNPRTGIALPSADAAT
jgi:hypothetical protein